MVPQEVRARVLQVPGLRRRSRTADALAEWLGVAAKRGPTPSLSPCVGPQGARVAQERADEAPQASHVQPGASCLLAPTLLHPVRGRSARIGSGSPRPTRQPDRKRPPGGGGPRGPCWAPPTPPPVHARLRPKRSPSPR